MGKKHYLKSDGNGGFNISKSLALLVLIITIFTSLVSVLVQGAILKEDIKDLQTEWQEAGPKHTQTIQCIQEDIISNQERINSHETNIAIVQTKLDAIQKSIDEIKEKL